MSEPLKIVIKAVFVLLLAIVFVVFASTTKASLDLQRSSLATVRIAGDNGGDSASEYVLPDSDKRYYTYDELDALTDEQLNFAHNEIYARHGRMFSDKRYADHFAKCSWYEPRYSPEEFESMPNQLNEFEMANSDIMSQIRTKRGIS